MECYYQTDQSQLAVSSLCPYSEMRMTAGVTMQCDRDIRTPAHPRMTQSLLSELPSPCVEQRPVQFVTIIHHHGAGKSPYLYFAQRRLRP